MTGFVYTDYIRRITFLGDRIMRREDDGTVTEISREVYEAERTAAEAHEKAARAAHKAEQEAQLAAAQVEKAKLERAIARLRGKRTITLAEHDKLNRLEERYPAV